MKVCKFGGSSLADAGQVIKVCDIIASDASRRVVVVSAPGKRFSDDIKVTDLLIACAEKKLNGENSDEALALIVDRFAGMASDLNLGNKIVEEIAANLEECLARDISHPERFMCGMKAAGEDNSARLVAAALSSRGIAASYLNPGDGGLFLSEEHGNAQILPESYEKLATIADRADVTVFPGFFGYTKGGDIVTFPRGGSDITGAVLSAAVKAELYENFTDVDSVLCADPGIVDDPAPVAELTFREMRELSYAGFGVLHDEAIQPAVNAGIHICIRNTNNPAAPGTLVVPERKYKSGQIVGIASSGGFSTIYVRKYLLNREIGFGRRLLQIFEEEGVSYEHTPSGIDDMSVIVKACNLSSEQETRIVTRIKTELEVDDVEIEHGLALVMIVGEGMRYSVGLVAKVVVALADRGVNIEMINQGSSEISVMFGVKESDRREAVQAIYGAFFETATSCK
jgi:aspartate kinase